MTRAIKKQVLLNKKVTKSCKVGHILNSMIIPRAIVFT